MLRNYEGYITTYEEPLEYKQHDKAHCQSCQHPRPEAGQGGDPRAAPGGADVDRARRASSRSTSAATRRPTASRSRPSGCPTASAPSRDQVVGDGRGLPVLEAGAVPATGATPEYAAGEEPRPPEGAPTATANHELL